MRRRKLQADYLCEFHLERAEHVLAEVVDHIRPISAAPELRLVWSNLRSLCKTCHDKHTLSQMGGVKGAAARPKGLKPSLIPLTIICGPSGSGKTTFVTTHAGPNDLILDLDAIKERIANGADYLGIGGKILVAGLKERNRLLYNLASDSTHERAWFIVGSPKACDRRFWDDRLKPEKIIVLEVDPGECSKRIEATRHGLHRDVSIETAFKWWEQYVRRDGDVVITAG